MILTNGEFNLSVGSLMLVQKGPGLIKCFDRQGAFVSYGSFCLFLVMAPRFSCQFYGDYD